MPPFTLLTVKLLTEAVLNVLTVATVGGYALPLIDETVRLLILALESTL